MPKRMTIIFDDEDLYEALRLEAARQGRHTTDIVTEAVQEWLAAREDEDLQEEITQARDEWQQLEGIEAGEFFDKLEVDQGR